MDSGSQNRYFTLMEKKIVNVKICLAHSDRQPPIITGSEALISLILKLHVWVEWSVPGGKDLVNEAGIEIHFYFILIILS